MTINLIFISSAALLLIILAFASYVKAPPAVAFIISGLSKNPRVLIGKGGFRVPFFERLDKVYLGQITVDIKTDKPVPTKDYINVAVDAVAKIRVNQTTVDSIRVAAKNFMNMDPKSIANELRDSLQGNMREIVGTLTLMELNNNRDGFSDQVSSKAAPDMQKLGIEILSCNIQDITDANGLIKDLGAENTEKIRKDALINKAKAQRDVQIEEAKARKDANDQRVLSETAIAERDNDLVIKQAELKQESDIKKAKAAAAYLIEEQEQKKEINRKTIDAQTEQTVREQELTKQKIEVERNTLEATINRQADAEKYKIETQAAAELEQRKRDAEAKTYEAEQEALAIKAKAEAKRYEMEQDAIGVKAKGDAEAYSTQVQAEAKAKGIEAEQLAIAEGIKAKGLAEAQAMEKKAEAYSKYDKSAQMDMIISVLPQMAKEIAQPMSAINALNIYGTNADGTSQMSGQVPVIMKQVMDTMSSATGVDMSNIIKSNTIEAKTDRNISIDGDLDLSPKNNKK